jgi:TolB protein
MNTIFDRRFLVACLALSLVALAPGGSFGAAPQEGAGQDPEIVVVLEGNARPLVRIAVPEIQGISLLPPSRREFAQQLDQTLRADLEASGIFSIQGPTELSILTLSGDLGRDVDQYRSTGNEILLDASVREEAGKMVVEGRLFELTSRRDLMGKRYRGDYSIARRIAHTFADDIVFQFTGRKGLGLTKIAFWSDRTEFREIFEMDYDGHNQRQITKHESISMSPEWSPSLDGLAYVSYWAGPPGIYFADIATGRKHELVADGFHNGTPSFSPDGRRIAFARSLGGNWEIFLANRDGSNMRRLTHSPRIDTNPVWSPTGREIAFTSSRSGNPHIYLMDAEGANLRRISFEGDYNDGADWNPDGTHLVYATRRNGVFQLALTDLVTLETRLLTTGRSSHETPSFSPDGRKVAYSLTVNGKPQIYVLDLRSGDTWALTTEGRNWSPSWSGFLE